MPRSLIDLLRITNARLSGLRALIELRIARKVCSNLVITYDADMKQDGTGAQVQRLFGVYALSRLVNSQYLHTPIKDVAIHPLDPFQSSSEYRAYLSELNLMFAISSSLKSPITQDAVSRENSPALSRLIILGVVSQLTGIRRIVRISEPYAITEFFQDSYDQILEKLENWHLRVDSLSDVKKQTIAIHYRQGVGGHVIYPGQRIPRELNLEYFVRKIEEILTGRDKDEYRVLVLTDAPISARTFTPPEAQKSLWEGSPGYSNGEMRVSAFSFDLLKSIGVEYQVINGGNPIDAIAIMASSNYLLTGRSSLSFIAGILNQSGQVYAAPDFWHRPLTRWHSQ